MRGKCNICGAEDELVNGMCPNCLTLSMYIENDLDSDLMDDEDDINTEADEADIDDEDKAKVLNKKGESEYTTRVNQIAMDAELFKRIALLGKKVEKAKDLTSEAGIDNNELNIFKDDFNKLYNKYKELIDSKEYKLAKADKDLLDKIRADKDSYEIVDTSRGLIVYKEIKKDGD